MSVLRRDENPPVGFSCELDMGTDGVFKVDVFRANEPVASRWVEQVLLEASGFRCSDEVLDSVTIAMDLADAKVLMGVLKQAIEFIERERQARVDKRKETK